MPTVSDAATLRAYISTDATEDSRLHACNARTHIIQSESTPLSFLAFSPNGWEFLVQILQAYYTLLSTLDYTFLFN